MKLQHRLLSSEIAPPCIVYTEQKRTDVPFQTQLLLQLSQQSFYKPASYFMCVYGANHLSSTTPAQQNSELFIELSILHFADDA